MVTRNEKLTLKWKSSNVKNSKRLVKTKEPMSGIVIWIAKRCVDFQCAACEDTKLRLSKLSHWGNHKMSPKKSAQLGCLTACVHLSARSLNGIEKGGAPPYCYGKREPKDMNYK